MRTALALTSFSLILCNMRLHTGFDTGLWCVTFRVPSFDPREVASGTNSLVRAGFGQYLNVSAFWVFRARSYAIGLFASAPSFTTSSRPWLFPLHAPLCNALSGDGLGFALGQSQSLELVREHDAVGSVLYFLSLTLG